MRVGFDTRLTTLDRVAHSEDSCFNSSDRFLGCRRRSFPSVPGIAIVSSAPDGNYLL